MILGNSPTLGQIPRSHTDACLSLVPFPIPPLSSSLLSVHQQVWSAPSAATTPSCLSLLPAPALALRIPLSGGPGGMRSCQFPAYSLSVLPGAPEKILALYQILSSDSPLPKPCTSFCGIFLFLGDPKLAPLPLAFAAPSAQITLPQTFPGLAPGPSGPAALHLPREAILDHPS